MHVKLISYSQPAREVYGEGLKDVQDLVAFCARVSNPSNQYNTETTDKLMKYLLKHKHFSPFEMVNVCLEVQTTRDIARQFLRHRSFSFQEFSQRYADPTKDLSFELREARLQDTKNRQNSFDIPKDSDLQKQWEKWQQNVITEAQMAYQWAIENGIAKEQARAVLPEGNTVSRLYVNGTIRSWLHYCDLRMGVETQKEHREIAQACAEVIAKVFPMADEFVSQ